MRNLADVLTEIRAVIPPSEAGLLSEIGKIEKSLLYAAPEASGLWWRHAAIVLSGYTFEGDTRSWVAQTRAIFAGRA